MAQLAVSLSQPIRPIEDLISNCNQCKSSLNERTVVNALDSLQAYSRIRELSKSLTNSCRAISDDHFRADINCKLEELLKGAAYARLVNCAPDSPRTVKLSGQVIILEENYSLFMSALGKKEDKTETQSDLTGDGGQLIFTAINGLALAQADFQAVYDIGAQDTDFVKRFTHQQVDRFVLDINILTPFLQTQEVSVKYLIGDAETLLSRDLQCLNPRPGLGRRLFAMSNFFNVLPPAKGWAILRMIPKKMQNGDFLAITNISEQQFVQRNEDAIRRGRPPRYTVGIEVSGFVSFNQEDKFYKTTISAESFIASFTAEFRNFSCDYHKENTLLCRVSETTNVNVLFITIIFKCHVDQRI